MNNKRVCVVGSINYDIISKQKRLPNLGETFLGESIHYACGGKGANQAVQLAKLGVNIDMIASVGSDYFGRLSLEELKKTGVNIRNIKIYENEHTGMGLVHSLENGEVYATIISGANNRLTISAIEKIDFSVYDMIVLQLEIPQETIDFCIDKCTSLNIPVLLNAAPARHVKLDILIKIDYLIVNEAEAEFFLNKPVKSLEQAKKEIVNLGTLTKGVCIITLGEKGSIIYDKGSICHIPAHKTCVIETTGAGDSYIGAFIYKILLGESLINSCRFAAKVSSITVSNIGGQNSMPYLNEILA